MLDNKIYERNISAMEKRFPGMRKIIEEGRKTVKQGIEVDLGLAQDESPIVRLKRNGHSLYVSGKRQPRERAKRIIERWGTLNRASTIFVLGTGDVAFLKELLDTTEKEINIMVYEPCAEIFFRLMEEADITQYFEDRPLGLIIEGINEMDMGEVIASFIQLANVEYVKHYENVTYQEIFQEETLKYLKAVNERIDRVIVNKKTAVRYASVEADNILHNIWYLCGGSITTQLCDVLPIDIPAIVVSAGPSLNRNIQELKMAKNKAFIVAVDTAVRPMVKAGIIPDMYVVVDGLKPIGLFAFEEAKKIPLMTSISAAKDVLKHHQGKKIFWYEGQPYIWNMMVMNGTPFSTVACGGSVACAAFSVVYKLGFSRIILVGQDLALTGNKTHADGTFQEKMEEIDTSRYLMVEGNCEEKVPTRGDFKLYLDWFNYYIAGCEGIHVMNATEGGAKIQNTEIITLKEAVARECKKEVDMDACFEKLQPIFDEEQRKHAVEYLNSFPEMLRKIKKDVEKLQAQYRKLNRICRSGKVDGKAYRKLLEQIKKLTGEVEGHELYDLISSTLSVAEYVITSEQFYVEDTLEEEGREIARVGIKYTQLVGKCIDLLLPLAEETVGKMQYETMI
ncbi:6-hydroxymethylpterin diphosphokinase MptE-like protein [Lachnospiraceae bacterium 29-84]